MCDSFCYILNITASWLNWGSWGCSVTCGIGTNQRSRECDMANGIPCVGANLETNECVLPACQCES